MKDIEGHLFLHRYFMEYQDQFMACADYYVIQNNIAYHIHVGSGEKTNMGKPDDVFLFKSCKDLGLYADSKIKKFDSKWISKDKLFSILEREGCIVK